MYGRFAALVGTVLVVILLTDRPAVAQIADREQLGLFSAGDVISVPLDEIIAPTRLHVEIDGRRITSPMGFSGNRLVLRTPDGLIGARHQIVVSEITASGRRHIGSWEFETAAGGWNSYVSVLSETGVRSAHGHNENYGSAGGRVDFELGDGRFRGGLSFNLREAADSDTGDRMSIDDWFLETRGALAGDTLRLRLGSHYFYSDSLLFDQGSRRGISFRLTDPSGGHDSTLFALQASQATGTRNLTGLEDSQDRIAGFTTRFAPVPGSALQMTLSGYRGRALNLPDGDPGAVNGYGLALSGPLGRRVDFLLSYDQTDWQDGTGRRRGNAIKGETNFDITPRAWDGTLGLSLSYGRIEDDFHAPMNPDIITGEEVVSLGLTRDTREWSLSGELAVGRTNVSRAADLPTDRLSRASLNLTYAPEVFTGGFLNGTSFYAGAEMLRQDRIDSPAGAVAQSDNTIWLWSLGLNRFQPDHSFALLYTYSVFDDRSGQGQNYRIHAVESLLSFAPHDRFESSLSAKLEHNDGPDGTYWLGRGAAALRFDLIADQLAYGLEVGFERSDDPNAARGAYVGNELSWEFSRNHALVLSADYGKGSKANSLSGEDGWLFGIALRSDFSAARYR